MTGLYPFLKRPKNQSQFSRVVNVASYWAGHLKFNDMEFKTRRWNNDDAYQQSKQCNRIEKNLNFVISVKILKGLKK